MTYRRHPYPYDRRPTPTPADRRVAWRDLIADAQRHARLVGEGGQVAKDDQVAFAGKVVRIKAAPFPLDHYTARVIAEILEKAAGAFVAAATPEARADLAGLMAEAARCCDRLLTADAQRTIARTTGDHDS